MNPIRISGKNLGQLALPNFCPRCFWIRLKCGDKLPFQIFPGIFASIDSFSKKVTNAHFRNHGTIPHWFAEFGQLGEPTKVPHHTVFNIFDDATGVRLTGVPDEVFRRTDGGIFIADYKTARFTDNQDDLMPMYATQLRSYGLIAERIGLGRVRGLGLVYYQPPGEIEDAALDGATLGDGFVMKFSAKLLPIPLQPEMIPPLLRRVRKIHDMSESPAGRKDCKDCQLLHRLIEVAVNRSPDAWSSIRV